jgi:predicted nucleic acid-binding protein
VAALRVVRDTNVLLSDIAYPASLPGKILAAWRHGSLEVMLSAYILDELRRVLPRLARRHGLTSAERSTTWSTLFPYKPKSSNRCQTWNQTGATSMIWPFLGKLLAVLKTSGANYPITGDKDLLTMAERYPIVAPAAFWATHAGL